MLQMMPKMREEVRLYLKTYQRAAESRERARTIAVRAKRRQLPKDRHRDLVQAAATILRSGNPTKFEFEGACRHGLRVSLIFEGWSWADADATSKEVVQSALNQLGAVRPTHDEAGDEFVGNNQVERICCARCGGRIDDERKGNSTPAKYCSSVCGNAARSAKNRAADERVSLAEHLARQALRSAQTVLERSGNCEQCNQPFISARAGRRFCSNHCKAKHRQIHHTARCANCEEPFKPRIKSGVLSTFCSTRCRDIKSIKPRPTLKCQGCGTNFEPRFPSKKPKYCSRYCSAKAQSVPRSSIFQCVETSK